MKKNVMMRVASIMLVLVLMSSSVISGTFAKYVTSDSASDTARVAKFGVVATVDGTLFYDAYNYNHVGYVEDETSAGITVEADTQYTKVVAPGTGESNALTINLTGTPEVDVAVVFTFSAESEIMLEADTYTDNPTTGAVNDEFKVDVDYYPVVFTLKDGNGNVLESGNVAKIQSYLTDKLNKTYHTNTNLAEIVAGNNGVYTLSWDWAFESGNDAADTYLGNAIAGGFPTEGATTAMNVTFSLSVTQID